MNLSQNNNTNFTDKAKDFFKDLWTFVRMPIFFKHLGIAVGATIGLFIIVLISLNMYTNHGEAISVPDFRGMNLEQVTAAADAANLNFEIIDSVYNAPGKKGTIVEQTPTPGFKVKEKRKIFLTIKTLTAEKISIPNFIGVSLIQVKADIETYGLKIGQISYRPDIATNNVLEQNINGKPVIAGTLIEKGTPIDLVLGQGKGDRSTTVPDLNSLTLTEAQLKINEAFLTLGNIIYDESIVTHKDSISAFVWKQSPESFSSLLVGGNIDIWLTVMNETE